MATKRASDEDVRFFDDLVRCETRLYNALGEVLRAQHGIAMSQFELMRHIHGHPSSRIADVAANFAAGVGAISKGVDRLEGRGLVVRHPNPTDGRSSLVILTPAGERLVAEAERTFRERLADLLSSVQGPTEVRSAGEALGDLRAALERGRVGLPVG